MTNKSMVDLALEEGLSTDDLRAVLRARVISHTEAELLLGIRPRTFSLWTQTGKLPEPLLVLGNGTRLWDKRQIEELAGLVMGVS